MLIFLDDYKGWRFLFTGLLGTWYLSRLWAFSLSRNLRLNREVRFDWVQVGDSLEQRFTLSNTSGFPAVTVEIRDHTDVPGFSGSLATGIEGHNTNRWRKVGICQQRGIFKVGPTTLLTSDPLNLFQVKIYDPRTINFLVKPPVLLFPEIDVSPGGRVGMGRPHTFVTEQTVSAKAVRPFVVGEPLNRIHWPTSARREALYVRTFESRPSGDWWILLDVHHKMQKGNGPDSTLEHGVILAASLCDRGLRSGRSVGLAALGENLLWLEPKHGEERIWEALEMLALLKSGDQPFQDLLKLIEPRLTESSSLVLITPDTSGSWLEYLPPILWKGVRPTVLLLEAADPDNGKKSLPIEYNLYSWGIQTQWITQDIFDRPESYLRQNNKSEWRITPFGGAVLIKPGREANWRGFQ